MIFIGLGGNMPSPTGAPEVTLRAALQLMPQHNITVRKVSPFYKSAPVPVSDQPWFVNAVAEVETKMQPQALMHTLLRIERSFGRQRGRKNDPRSIDLDLLDYNGAISNEVELELPHPRLRERAFVLYPLRDIAPDWKHPAGGEDIATLITRLSPQVIAKN